MNKNIRVSPSLLAVDFMRVDEALQSMIENDIEVVHYDVMDGHFVPNLSFGTPIIKQMNNYNLKCDVHLMVYEPQNMIPWFDLPHVEMISFHFEATKKHQEVIDLIKSMNKMVGIAIKPNTTVQQILPFIKQLDFVLVMSVEPGFGGQSFIENTYNKVEMLNEIRQEKNLNLEIHVDGGVNFENGKKLSQLGANQLVMGTAYFKQDNPKEEIEKL